MSCPTVIVDNTPLSVVSKHRYLGLVFDECLTLSHHITKVCKSLSYYLYSTCYLNVYVHGIMEDLFKILTESLVLSHLIYSLPVWSPSFSKYSLQRIKYLQN